jgi:hypothetical protein
MITFPFSFIQDIPAETLITNGLQLYLDAGDVNSYPGSGTSITDLSVNGYTATLENGVGFDSLDSGGAFTFDGGTSYINTNQSLESEEFSVGAWFKSSASGIKMILSKEVPAGNPWNYRIWLNGGRIVADISQLPSFQASLQSSLTNYNNGNWYSVMFTRNDTNWHLYVNGIQIATRVDPYTGSITNNQALWFGRSAFTASGSRPTGSYPYNGSLGEMIVYNRVLSSSEIIQNFNATKSRYGL